MINKEENLIITPEDYMAQYIDVLDLDTGEIIERCVYANQETGEYRVSLTKEEAIEEGYLANDDAVKYLQGNIVLVYKGE